MNASDAHPRLAGAAAPRASAWRRALEERSLVAQFTCAALLAGLVSALLVWRYWPAEYARIASLAASGVAATAVAAWLANRVRRFALQAGLTSRTLSRDALGGSENFAAHASSDELRRLTIGLRRLVDEARQRIAALEALNAALGRQLEQRTQTLSTLQDLSIGLASKTDLSSLVEEALRALERTVDYSSASVWGRGERDGGPVVLLGCRSVDATDEQLRSLVGQRLSSANLQRYEQIERERRPIVENHVRQGLLSWLWTLVTDDARTSELYRATRAWMALPLQAREQVVGVLRVDHHEPDYFDAERGRLLAAIGSQTALAMRHSQLLTREREVAIAAERNRIARDLHDAVSQTLFAANMIAGTLAAGVQQSLTQDPAALERQARALERLNRGALAEMRQLMFELRPDALEQARLADLLQHSIDALASRGAVVVRHSLSRDDRLAAGERVHLYRIAQEALSNAARHSGASNIVVEWSTPEGAPAVLRIADDGRGFDPQQVEPGGFGLGNMQSRAAEIGATLEVTSAPGSGTQVRVELRASE